MHRMANADENELVRKWLRRRVLATLDDVSIRGSPMSSAAALARL